MPVQNPIQPRPGVFSEVALRRFDFVMNALAEVCGALTAPWVHRHSCAPVRTVGKALSCGFALDGHVLIAEQPKWQTMKSSSLKALCEELTVSLLSQAKRLPLARAIFCAHALPPHLIDLALFEAFRCYRLHTTSTLPLLPPADGHPADHDAHQLLAGVRRHGLVCGQHPGRRPRAGAVLLRPPRHRCLPDLGAREGAAV